VASKKRYQLNKQKQISGFKLLNVRIEYLANKPFFVTVS